MHYRKFIHNTLFALTLAIPSLLIGDEESVVVIEGSGSFRTQVLSGVESIQVYYHKPSTFNPDSPILFVIPGAGRDGDEYRDAWVESAEKYGVLVLSPLYPENSYDFGGYHMGGVMKNFGFKKEPKVEPTPNGQVIFVDEKDFDYSVNYERQSWLFPDFDLIFEKVKMAVGLDNESYDIFGHSAGGQILHRLIIFYPETRAKNILASNSGFYTLPDFSFSLPFGLSEFEFGDNHLKSSLQKNLVLFVGELDNASETKGTRLRSPIADLQGYHRLERAHYFFSAAESKAKELGIHHNWKLEIVPGVGHDQKNMGKAAADYLYGP